MSIGDGKCQIVHGVLLRIDILMAYYLLIMWFSCDSWFYSVTTHILYRVCIVDARLYLWLLFVSLCNYNTKC